MSSPCTALHKAAVGIQSAGRVAEQHGDRLAALGRRVQTCWARGSASASLDSSLESLEGSGKHGARRRARRPCSRQRAARRRPSGAGLGSNSLWHASGGPDSPRRPCPCKARRRRLQGLGLVLFSGISSSLVRCPIPVAGHRPHCRWPQQAGPQDRAQEREPLCQAAGEGETPLAATMALPAPHGELQVAASPCQDSTGPAGRWGCSHGCSRRARQAASSSGGGGEFTATAGGNAAFSAFSNFSAQPGRAGIATRIQHAWRLSILQAPASHGPHVCRHTMCRNIWSANCAAITSHHITSRQPQTQRSIT
jgi:hypothetical protein